MICGGFTSTSATMYPFRPFSVSFRSSISASCSREDDAGGNLARGGRKSLHQRIDLPLAPD
jgi:hypothetical protein